MMACALKGRVENASLPTGFRTLLVRTSRSFVVYNRLTSAYTRNSPKRMW